MQKQVRRVAADQTVAPQPALSVASDCHEAGEGDAEEGTCSVPLEAFAAYACLRCPGRRKEETGAGVTGEVAAGVGLQRAVGSQEAGVGND